MMVKKIAVSFLLGVFLLLLIQLPSSAGQDSWWDETWSFRQKIILPPLTGDVSASYQPVDTTLRFDSPCWAVNETIHSVRVICQTKTDDLVLESQLYELAHSNETHITSCNLVFLIPPQIDGTEQYYVYYDESQTSPPGYPDHVSIEDSSYYYEPVSGYPLESHFYKISQNDTIRYIIAQEGTFLWYTTAQCVTKLQEGSTEVMPKNGIAVTSFEFAYYYGDEMWQYYSTSQELVSKEILCDGTLMVSCKIISRSTGGNLQTTAVYKYFYCPTSSERIQAHVIHEALRDCQVYHEVDTDGTYAALQCGGIKSASIADLNFGELYPFFHLYSEQNTVEEYQVDLHPEYMKEDPLIRLLQTSDDVDIGKKAWVAFDEGTTGTVHALVFGNSSVVKEGEEERDGIQIKMYESNYPHLPGLDYTIAALQCTRNSYEKDVPGKDTVIPEGYIAEYDAEFFSSPVGGYPLVEKETTFFQALVPMKPSITNDAQGSDDASVDRFSLKVFVHDAPSFPFGSVFSALTGRAVPYITIELYRDTTLVSAGTAGRLPLKGSVSSEGSSLKQSIAAVIHSLDVRNLTLFKKYSFEQLESGRYLVKVFRENPRFGNQRQFIGCMVVDLTKDSQVHVVCRPQGSCRISLVDQQGTGVSNADVILLQDGMVVAHNTTNVDGSVLFTVPVNRKDPYQLKILYHGFELVNESITVKYIRMVVPLEKTTEIERYDWSVSLVDLWGLPLEIDVIPRLTSTLMQFPTVLVSQERNHGTFHFIDLIPATYQLQIQYKSFVVEKEIPIPSTDETVVFPAVFPVSLRVFDSRGIMLGGTTIQVSRGGITQKKTSNDSSIIYLLPPGSYLVSVFSQGAIIGQRSITVLGERGIDLITNQEPIFPQVVIVLGCILSLGGAVLGLRKKEPLYFSLFLLVSMVMVAFVLPWWGLQGSTSNIQTVSNLYLTPLSLVSTTTTSQVIAGDQAFLPEIFIVVMTFILLLSAIICLLGIVVLFLNWINRKKFQSVLLIAVLILLLCSLGLFIGAMSAFTEVGVGSFIGDGTLDISVPGEGETISVLCSWGPGEGFWLYVLVSLLLISTLIIRIYKKVKKKMLF